MNEIHPKDTRHNREPPHGLWSGWVTSQKASARFVGKNWSILIYGEREGPHGPLHGEDAGKKRILKPGGTIVEGFSGNTGAALAMISAVKEIPVHHYHAG